MCTRVPVCVCVCVHACVSVCVYASVTVSVLVIMAYSEGGKDDSLHFLSVCSSQYITQHSSQGIPVPRSCKKILTHEMIRVVL